MTLAAQPGHKTTLGPDRDALNRAILRALRKQAMTVRDLGAALGVDLTTLNEQLTKLRTRCEVTREEAPGWRSRYAKSARWLWRVG